MIENRCHNCNALLFRMVGEGQVEVICPKCRRINYIENGKHEFTGLRGKLFQEHAKELRNPESQKLFCRVIGRPFIEIKCRYTKKVFEFDLEKIYAERRLKIPARKIVA